MNRVTPERHLDARRVLDYLDDRLAAADRVRVEDHLAGPCCRCRDLVRDVGRVLDAMRTDRVPRVPEAVRARALAVFGIEAAPSASVGGVLQLAKLVFDSLVDPLPAPVRRSLGEARWLKFELGDHLLELETELEAGEAWTLRGRLRIPEPALHRIDVEAGGERRSTWPDSDGSFVLERIPSGPLDVQVTGPEARHRLPPFTL